MEGDEIWVSSPRWMGSNSNVQESLSRNDGTVASALDSASWLPCASVGGQVHAVVSSMVNNDWYTVKTTMTESTYHGYHTPREDCVPVEFGMLAAS
jgi:hypothetical protein